ncbi:uncharacterized protein LOC132068644 [Lycium ferocissimum]|uniref:uncharacterized protein LOC132068644 n=1 Tax=Lycium ferocissimum TaxID=112874 RepID=UPI0028157D5E|nr:uncharacterized protein LOC132068644 [Lycium ferocissimum]
MYSTNCLTPAKQFPITIKWFPPNQDGIKLNFDGAFPANTTQGGFGGVFRDKNANWVAGYHQCTSSLNSTQMEIQGFLEGLRLVCLHHFNISEIETYATEVLHEESGESSNPP